jgi:hypothetical protein
MGDKCSELRVALQDPSINELGFQNVGNVGRICLPPGSNTIGDIGKEVPSLELDKVLEDSSLEKLTVQLCHTINLERSDNSKESHSDVFGSTFLYDRHSLDSTHIVGPSLGYLSEEFEVDLVDDLQMSRKEFLEQADFPFLKCLG